MLRRWGESNPHHCAVQSTTSAAVAEGTGGAGGPGYGARGRRRGLAGLRDDAPSAARGADGSRAGRYTGYGARHPIRRGALPTDRVQHTRSQEQTRNLRDAGLAAVPVGGGEARTGTKTTRRTRQQRPGTTGAEGAGGTGGHGRASRRGAERSEALASRAAGPSGARNTRGATSNNTQLGRRAAAHGRIKQPGLSRGSAATQPTLHVAPSRPSATVMPASARRSRSSSARAQSLAARAAARSSSTA